MIKVLMVEDEILNAFVLSLQLKQLGYQVVDTVTEGEMAIEILKKDIPDLILMDVQLRGKLNGIETMEIIRTFSDLPVIYITSYTDALMMERMSSTRRSNILQKPYREEQLAAMLVLALESDSPEDNVISAS
ncbi:response regulator [Cytophagaceae bacterium DM2B3-1]|uniref:Response regulator n=1 Tax=Xanthocytophaga flava TaxID=3048013 RepID=A0ABT7CKE3_9BACT|nr:response regulator [Xanthocytophaga flavus]MDJ1470750.1 response regulator [Xanthocytophaga flavus]MDJ1493149.1 response regulator [Xanthocytophaga flavus]